MASQVAFMISCGAPGDDNIYFMETRGFQCIVTVEYRFNLQCTQIARFMWPTWVPPGAGRTQVGPWLAPWTLLSGQVYILPCETFHKIMVMCWFKHSNRKHFIATETQYKPNICHYNIPAHIITRQSFWGRFNHKLNPSLISLVCSFLLESCLKLR